MRLLILYEIYVGTESDGTLFNGMVSWDEIFFKGPRNQNSADGFHNICLKFWE